MRKLLYKTISLVFLLGLFSCENEDNATSVEFDRAAMLENIANNIILPTYEETNTSVQNLHSKAQTFVDNPTESNLESVRTEWQNSKLIWKKAEIFNFGPVDDLFIATSIDLFPTDVTDIENVIASTETIDQTLLQRLGSNRKGYPAIEYLLFSEDLSTTVNGFVTESRRGQFLLLLTDDLQTNIASILNEWSANGNSYLQTFVEATDNSAAASATLLANEMIFLLEVLRMNRIARPAGLEAGKDLDARLVESFYAKQSIPLALQTLDAVEQVFTGGTGEGFDDYLDFLEVQGQNDLLSEEIKAQITVCKTALQSLSMPLQDAISNEASQVTVVFEELQKLNVLLKADMMSNLGLVIIFSDNDGD